MANVRMNPIRKELLKRMDIALKAHAQREDIGDMRHYYAAIELNNEFIDRGRGKAKPRRRYIRSVANARIRTTYFPPHKRNGAKERARRV